MTTPLAWSGEVLSQSTNMNLWVAQGIVGIRRLGFAVYNLPVNNGNTDFQINWGDILNWAGATVTSGGTNIITPIGQFYSGGGLVPGFTGTVYYAVRGFQVNDPTAGNLSSTTLGLFTATGGGGTTVVTNAALSNLNAATQTLNQDMSIAAAGLYTNRTMYIRVGTASGVANSTVDCYGWVEVMP